MRSKLLLFAFLAMGCASGPRPIQSDTQLGKVIIYRNGVAYFERFAEPEEQSITLRVPSERVDDFLKSLSIVDEATKKPLAVSYPTMEAYDGYVEMKIALPPRQGRLRITYVTESPAWKPTYRVVLDEGGKGRLHGWAVVDNTSGEDWDRVRVGVGSTSALSFRYDLRSVRVVERETLSDGAPLAAAPPVGGSPYAVAKRKLRVVGSLSQGDLAEFGRYSFQSDTEATKKERARQAIISESTTAARVARGAESKPQAQMDMRSRSGKKPGYLEGLSKELKDGKRRVRIEGYAQPGDADPHRESTARANALRDRLVAMGVPADNLETVGVATMNSQEAVRLIEAEETGGGSDGTESEAQAEDTLPVGHAHFVSKHALTIAADHSAMVSILNAPTKAERVYFYDPVSQRGSKTHAFNAVRIVNPSRYTLDGGPFTIYTNGQFLGEGLSEPILPGAVAFIPYALDRSIVVEQELATREEIDELVSVQRGIVTAESQRIRRTALSIANRGRRDAEVYVRHKVASGYTLSQASRGRRAELEKLGGAHLFRVKVAAGETVELVVEEQTPLRKTVDIRTQSGIDAVALFLKKRRISRELAEKLDGIVRTHTKQSDLEERIRTLDEQMTVYRTRVDELNSQLFTLKKVREANRLRQHLSEKMEEISGKLQQATMEITDHKGQLMTLRIELQDRIAELTLAPRKDRESLASK
ncbi:MAG TPA: hypothetical protein VFB62_24260 [Polyangiaceae bacterium]|jgi:hypothetical protein|nr:hypothetical protein [Polyangiaceae bacterium]